MKLFIWHNVERATNNYHNDGAVVAIAPDLSFARRLMTDAEVPVGCGAFVDDPDVCRECEGPAFVMVYQDAGCC